MKGLKGMEFQEVYNTYVSKVYSYIKFKIKDIHLIKDIVQDTFISIYKDSLDYKEFVGNR